MSWSYSYPRYGMQRGGTLTYVNGGGAYGRFSGWGQEGGGQSTTPTSAAGTPPMDVINALYAQAAEQTALGTASLVTGNATAGAAQLATAANLYKRAEDIKAGRITVPLEVAKPGSGGLTGTQLAVAGAAVLAGVALFGGLRRR